MDHISVLKCEVDYPDVTLWTDFDFDTEPVADANQCLPFRLLAQPPVFGPTKQLDIELEMVITMFI